MTDLEWTRALVVLGMAGQIALAVDRWVHRQSGAGTRLKERLDEMDLRVRAIVLSMEAARERTHKKNGYFQRAITRMELALALISQRAGTKFPRITEESDDEDEEAS